MRLEPRTWNARSLALAVLVQSAEHDAFVQDLLDHNLRLCDLSPADRRLATQLAYGVLRRQGTLDALLAPLVKRPREEVEPWLWDALRLGVFQMALLTHIPPHAAIYETVELAEAWSRPRAKGFLNAVLRRAAPLFTDARTAAPAADALPLQAGEYRQLAHPAFPDPPGDPAGYFAAAFGFPTWLAQRWHARYGPDECLRLGFWFSGPAPMWLRVNPLRIAREEFLQKLREAGVEAEAGEPPQAVRLGDFHPVRELPGFDEGWFVVQDASAMLPASALAPRPMGRVLDLCAAPGGKSTHLAELMQGQGLVVACDRDERKLRQLQESYQRLRLLNVLPCLLESDQDLPPDRPYEAVLVDVPCSNTGVLGRRPEARWRLQPNDWHYLVPLQKRLLRRACESVAPGGAVVYSTCSIEPEENADVVRAVLAGLPAMAFEAEHASLPGQPADGGYWARLRRTQ